MSDHLQQADRTLEDLGAILGDLCAAPASCDAPCRAVTMLLDSSSSRFWRSFYALKKRRQDDGLNVAVLALTKSGKSTLLNALVGAELLPMNNVPETARICKVVHTGGGEPYLVEPDTAGSSKAAKAQAPVVTARGEAAVRARLRQLNQAVRDRSSSRAAISRPRTLQPSTSLGSASGTPALGQATSLPGSLDGPSTLSGRSSTGSGPTDDDCAAALAANTPTTPSVATGLPMDKMLEIHAPVAALLEYAPAGHQGGHVRLQLLDTPGPNEAGEEELKHQVERLLDGVDVALYLLDYTKLKTQDEAGMFERLRLVNPALVKRLSQRLFFVVNKVDAAQVSEGQDLEVTKEYVADLVTRQMDLEGFQLQPEQVLLLSARNGLLSRLILRGTASLETRQRFIQLAFGRFANPATISQDQLVGAAHALLADSGLLDLEAQVLAYLYTHAAAVKHLALVDDLGRLLAEVRNVATSCAAALSASAEALAARVGEVRGQLNQTLARFESVQNNADAIGNEVAREVHAHLHTLRGRLFSSIINALDTSNSAPAAAPAPAATPTARRWHGVRERFLSIFTGRGSGGVFSTNPTNISSGSGPGSAYYRNSDVEESGDSAAAMASMMNAAGGAVARSRSKAELAALLGALHEDLTTQIHAEVREFWAVMEAVAGARHAELLATLNNHLAELSQQVEGAVSRSLDVRLSPVTLQLTPPDASQFHADLDGLLARGLVETREKHIRVNQKQVTEQVLRRGGGICRWGDYWESVPRMRTVVEAYTLSVYEVVPSEITAHFISMVDNAVDSTQASLEAYVSQFVGTQLKEARQQLQEYSDCYLGVMTGALDANHKGSEHRLAALEQVRSLLSRINDVSSAYDTLKDATEGSVPRAQEPIAYDDLDDLSEDEREVQDSIEEEDRPVEEAEQEEGQQEHARALAAGAALHAEQTYESADEGEEEEESRVAARPQGMEGGGEEEEEALLPLLSEASALIAPFAQQLEVEQQCIAPPEESSALPSLDSSLVAAEGTAVGVPAFEPAGPVADAASDAATVYTPLPPGSPMSVSSSVVNALLRTSLDGHTPAPAAPIAPTEDTTLSAAPPVETATGVAVVDTVDPAGVGMEVPSVAVGGNTKVEMAPGGTLTSPRPFDYGEAMSSQMSSSQLGSVGTEEGHGVAQADLALEGAEGSDDWDLVDGKEAQAA